MRATIYVSLLTCIIAVGACIALARQYFADMRARIDDVSAKINAPISHEEDRQIATFRALHLIGGRKFVLVIGDSITEAAQLPGEICGLPVINAGIGGSRAADFIPFVEDISSSFAAPAATVVALGINDAQSVYWNKSKERQFRASYDLLLSMLPPDAMVTTLTPIDISQTVGKRFSPVAWSAINLAVRDAAANRNATLIDVGPAVVASGTIDGVHLSAASSQSWREIVTNAIKKRLGC